MLLEWDIEKILVRVFVASDNLLAPPNEAESKAANEGGKVVAQFPLGRHEESVQEGPCAIPGNDDDGSSGDNHGDDEGDDDVEHTEDNSD